MSKNLVSQWWQTHTDIHTLDINFLPNWKFFITNYCSCRVLGTAKHTVHCQPKDGPAASQQEGWFPLGAWWCLPVLRWPRHSLSAWSLHVLPVLMWLPSAKNTNIKTCRTDCFPAYVSGWALGLVPGHCWCSCPLSWRKDRRMGKIPISPVDALACVLCRLLHVFTIVNVAEIWLLSDVASKYQTLLDWPLKYCRIMHFLQRSLIFFYVLSIHPICMSLWIKASAKWIKWLM